MACVVFDDNASNRFVLAFEERRLYEAIEIIMATSMFVDDDHAPTISASEVWVKTVDDQKFLFVRFASGGKIGFRLPEKREEEEQ